VAPIHLAISSGYVSANSYVHRISDAICNGKIGEIFPRDLACEYFHERSRCQESSKTIVTVVSNVTTGSPVRSHNDTSQRQNATIKSSSGLFDRQKQIYHIPRPLSLFRTRKFWQLPAR
jgi:hypothetical protein